MNVKKKVFIIFLLVIALFWCIGIIPSTMARISSTRYIKAKYEDLDLQFAKAEFSTAHGNYFAYFTDEDGDTYAFMLSSGRFLPVTVWYDPLDPPVDPPG